MSKRKTANTVILWVVSIGLLVSMVIAFTPTLGLGRNQNVQPETLMTVNGQKISELDFIRARNRTPLGSINEGEVGEDIQTLIFEQLINQELFASEAQKISVSNGEVRAALREFRENNDVAGRANEVAYLDLIRREGFSDESFRVYLRENERRTKFTESLLEGIEATDAQVRAYFASNSDNYLSEPKIVAREIVVDEEALAQDLRLRLDAPDADFAALASEYSIEKAEQGGALAGTNEEILPVGSVALPTVVAEAAFALQDGGLTDVIDSGGLYYIVDVILYVEPEPRPFAEVESDVRETVQSLVEAAVLEQKIEELRASAEIVFSEDSPYAYKNEPVATVGDREILRVDLANAVYNTPSIQNFLSPQSVDLISFFKPQILNELINNELAYQGASQLDADFFGTRASIARAALHHVSKDVTVSEEEILQYYNDNPQVYTNPAEGKEAQQFIAAGRDSAEALQLALIDGDVQVDENITETSQYYQASVQNLGTIALSDLPYNLQTPVFGVDSTGVSNELIALPHSSLAVSPIVPLSADESNFTFVVADIIPENLRPFEDVRSDAESNALNDKQQEARSDWLEQLRSEITVEDLSLSNTSSSSESFLPVDTTTVIAEPSFTTEPLPAGLSIDGADTTNLSEETPESSEPTSSEPASSEESSELETSEPETSESTNSEEGSGSEMGEPASEPETSEPETSESTNSEEGSGSETSEPASEPEMSEPETSESTNSEEGSGSETSEPASEPEMSEPASEPETSEPASEPETSESTNSEEGSGSEMDEPASSEPETNN